MTELEAKAKFTDPAPPIMTPDEKMQQTNRIIAFHLTQASNGLAHYQVEVAKRYLKGDGLPLDTALAAHWLRAACTNHDNEATNLLAKIPKQ